MRIKKTPSKRTPVKTAYSTVPGFNNEDKGTVSPNYKSVVDFTPSNAPGTLSPFKTYPGGAKSKEQEILTVEELLDLPMLNFTSNVPSAMYSQINSMNVTPTKDFIQKSEIFEGIGEKPYLGKRTFNVIGHVTFEDIQDGILSGKILWDQMNFDKKCLDYLLSNRSLLKTG